MSPLSSERRTELGHAQSLKKFEALKGSSRPKATDALRVFDSFGADLDAAEQAMTQSARSDMRFRIGRRLQTVYDIGMKAIRKAHTAPRESEAPGSPVEQLQKAVVDIEILSNMKSPDAGAVLRATQQVKILVDAVSDSDFTFGNQSDDTIVDALPAILDNTPKAWMPVITSQCDQLEAFIQGSKMDDVDPDVCMLSGTNLPPPYQRL